ncbi:hypothetical protein [Flavobacterium sp.]
MELIKPNVKDTMLREHLMAMTATEMVQEHSEELQKVKEVS